MPLASKPKQFNKEKFKNELRISSENYLKALMGDDMLYKSAANFNVYKKEKNILELRMKEEIQEIIMLSVGALKLSDNKSEIFDILFQTVDDLNSKINALSNPHQTFPPLYFLSKIILELLKNT
jgi:hypothetical protein